MRRSLRHRGFAMVTAIFLIAFTAMTVTEIGLTVAVDARRTSQSAQDTQLRQLLLAGGEFAVQHPEEGRYQMAVPGQVSAAVTIEVYADHSADIKAKLTNRRMSQHVLLTKINDSWQISQATLD